MGGECPVLGAVQPMQPVGFVSGHDQQGQSGGEEDEVAFEKGHVLGISCRIYRAKINNGNDIPDDPAQNISLKTLENFWME